MPDATEDTPVIIEAAINGETRPDRNPHAPRTAAEVVADVYRCVDSGASIIHAHTEDTRKTGRAAAELHLAAWRTNEEIVIQAAALVAEVGRPVAGTADTARLLALPKPL